MNIPKLQRGFWSVERFVSFKVLFELLLLMFLFCLYSSE